MAKLELAASIRRLAIVELGIWIAATTGNIHGRLCVTRNGTMIFEQAKSLMSSYSNTKSLTLSLKRERDSYGPGITAITE